MELIDTMIMPNKSLVTKLKARKILRIKVRMHLKINICHMTV